MSSMCAGAAAAMAAVKRRRLSCEVHRCNDDADVDDDTTTAAPTDKLSRHTSPSVVRRCRRVRDNSLMLVEVVCDCHGTRQKTAKTSRLRPRSASESPTNRIRTSSGHAATDPASDSEIIVRSTQSHTPRNSSAPILRVYIEFLLFLFLLVNIAVCLWVI